MADPRHPINAAHLKHHDNSSHTYQQKGTDISGHTNTPAQTANINNEDTVSRSTSFLDISYHHLQAVPFEYNPSPTATQAQTSNIHSTNYIHLVSPQTIYISHEHYCLVSAQNNKSTLTRTTSPRDTTIHEPGNHGTVSRSVDSSNINHTSNKTSACGILAAPSTADEDDWSELSSDPKHFGDPPPK